MSNSALVFPNTNRANNYYLQFHARRNHITHKVSIAAQHTLHIRVHDDEQPAEIFLRAKGTDRSSELIGLYDVITHLMSPALRYGAPPEKVAISSLAPNLNPAAPATFDSGALGILWSSCLLQERNGRVSFTSIGKSRKSKNWKSSSNDFVKMM